MSANLSETEKANPPYQTRATVAGNRLSDLIDALRRFDPDTGVLVSYVEVEDGRILLDGVEAIVGRERVPDAEALL